MTTLLLNKNQYESAKLEVFQKKKYLSKKERILLAVKAKNL